MVMNVDHQTSKYLGLSVWLVILNELKIPNAGLYTLHLKTQTECLWLGLLVIKVMVG